MTLNILVHDDMIAPLSQNKALILKLTKQYKYTLELYLEVLRYPSLLFLYEILNVPSKIGETYFELDDEKILYEILKNTTGIIDDCLKIKDFDFTSNETLYFMLYNHTNKLKEL